MPVLRNVHGNTNLPVVGGLNANPSEVASPLTRTMMTLTAEATTVAFGGLAAAKLGTAALIAAVVGTTTGAAKGAALGTKRSLNGVFPIGTNLRGLGVGLGGLALSMRPEQISYPNLAYGAGSHFLSGTLAGGVVFLEGIPQRATEEQIKGLMHSRIVEWGAGAAVGTLVTGVAAGVATSALGLGLSIAAGVVAMKATRAGVRYLFGR
jgi:hypothetical protein